jgi:hypothetical protein
MGGGTSIGNPTDGVEKTLFSNDSINYITSVLPTANQYSCGFADPVRGIGYSAGGVNNTAMVLKVTFSADATSSISTTMYGYGGDGFYSSVAGYAMGAGSYTDTGCYKLAFPNESVTTVSNARGSGHGNAGQCSCTESATDAYQGAGNTGTAIDKLTFANDSATYAVASFSTASGYVPAVTCLNGGSSYWFGGSGTPYTNRVDKLIFSNSAFASIASSVSMTANGWYGANGGYYSRLAGYGSGNVTIANPTVNKLTYSNETTSILTSTEKSFENSCAKAENLN